MTEAKTIAIIGGGLAGLTAAATLAQAGQSVTVFEKARALGGRAITNERNGFQFNLGPHALYTGGAAVRILQTLGVNFRGKRPPLTGGYALVAGTKQTLPVGLVSFLTTGALNLAAKLEAIRFLSGLPKLETRLLQRKTVRDWLTQSFQHEQTRQMVEAFFRLTTYANDPTRASAGVALAQLQQAFAQGVFYLDGGWQTLVEGLRQQAENAGAHFVTGQRVVALEHDGAVQALRLANGERWPVRAAVIAASPEEVATLLEPDGQGAWHQFAKQVVPTRAACLDVALERLPVPTATFGLGFEQPTYLSVHSATARLAPTGGALIHVMKYLDAEPADDAANQRELEGVLDLLQPGWHAVLRERRWLPHMLTSNALVTAAQGGLAGRPTVEAAGVRGVWLAGDWIGTEGLLADASVASGWRAAEMILQQRTEFAQAA